MYILYKLGNKYYCTDNFISFYESLLNPSPLKGYKIATTAEDNCT